MAVCRMADRQKSNMRTPEKWINVDESFAKKYPSLYQTITQMPEFIEHNKKAEAGISKAGNVKLLWALQVQTILTKKTRSPEIGIVAEGLRTVCVRLWKNSSNK